MSNTIKIRNCNNITSGEIDICADKLNILFGRNGTGKSTIARAIYLTSQSKPLTELAPYGSVSEAAPPSIEGVETGGVAIFDDNYVSQYVYQPDSLIKDAFEVLIRSNEYDEAKKNIDDALAKIKTTITGRQEIINLQAQIGVLIDTIKFTTNNKIAKRGGAKGVLEGKGAYFKPPEELSELKPFFEEDTVSKWAAWRLQGYELFGQKGRCPYCSTGDTEKTGTINKVFADSFDKASVETAAAIIKALEGLKPYLSEDKVSELVSLFGVKKDLKVLEAQLTKLRAEANYLHERLTAIVSFNGSSVDRNNITELESKLTDMKVDFRAIDAYFVSDLTKSEMGAVNSEIDSLQGKVGILKGEIGRYNKYIQDKIQSRKQDINDFLNLAGFKYMFDVEMVGENSARALLKFILPDGNSSDMQAPGQHLSWGEKHSFALILFMFDAIHSDANLVILDDPISSFDSNKKYAIIKQTALSKAEKTAKSAQDALTAFETQEQQWHRQTEELANAGELLALWNVKNSEADNIDAEIASAKKLQSAVKVQIKKAEQAKKKYEQARQSFAEKNAEYVEKQMAFLDAQAGFLAKEKLKPGEPCPVCGSKEHPQPCRLAEEHRDLTREIIDALAKEAEELQQEQTKASTASGSAADLLAEKQGTLSDALAKLRVRMVKSISDVPEVLTPEQAVELLSKWKSELKAEGTALQKNAETFGSVQESLKGANEKKQTLKAAADTATEQLSTAKVTFAAVQETLNGLQAQKDYPAEKDANLALTQATTTKEAADAAYDVVHASAQSAKTAKETSETLIERYEKELPAQKEERARRMESYQKILAEKALSEADWKAVTEQHEKLEAAVLQETITAHGTKKATAKGAFAAAKAAIGDAAKPVLEDLEAGQKAAEDALEAAQAALEQLKESYRVNHGAYLALAPKMEERGRITQEYTRMDSLYNRLAGKVTGARMDLETFVQRYHLQRILYAANERFQDMSAGQYELRMIGDDQAGEGKNRGLDLMVYSTVTGKEREVRTLSGGESFMAALSLALGMADQIQVSSASINLDMMFIDEGFGALDDHSRDQAVKVLQRMAAGSKLIGIISHVSELKQEIEDQLIVSKDEDGSRVKWVIS